MLDKFVFLGVPLFLPCKSNFGFDLLVQIFLNISSALVHVLISSRINLIVGETI